jgi:hypothetical protein
VRDQPRGPVRRRGCQVQRNGRCWHKRDVTDDVSTDAELVLKLRIRPELIGVLYERHAVPVYRFLARRCDSAAADDLLSEVFLAALSARSGSSPMKVAARCPGCTALRAMCRAVTFVSAEGDG